METEGKAKVVSSIWGAKICSIPSRASCFAPVYLEETVKFNRFFQIHLDKTASKARNWTNFAPPNRREVKLRVVIDTAESHFTLVLITAEVFYLNKIASIMLVNQIVFMIKTFMS